MYGALDISTSGLIAQRTRMTVISNNIAMKSTLLNSAGKYEPYRRQIVLFEPIEARNGVGGGVRVASIETDDSPLVAKLEPGSPYADEDGIVYYPNVDPVLEQMNAMEAQRAYEANIMAAEVTKSMMSVALQLLR